MNEHQPSPIGTETQKRGRRIDPYYWREAAETLRFQAGCHDQDGSLAMQAIADFLDEKADRLEWQENTRAVARKNKIPVAAWRRVVPFRKESDK